MKPRAFLHSESPPVREVAAPAQPAQVVQPTPAVPPPKKKKRTKRKVVAVTEAEVEEDDDDNGGEEESEEEDDGSCAVGMEENPVWNKYSRRVLHGRWVFEKNDRLKLEEEVGELRKERKVFEREVAGLKKSLAVEVGERRKLVDLRVVHGGKLDELERAGMQITNLKKEVKGLARDLKDAEDRSVAVLKLSHQKELQDVLFKSKTFELDLAVQKKLVATLEGSLKLHRKLEKNNY